MPFTVTRTTTELADTTFPVYTFNLPADVAAGDLIIAAASGDNLITSFAWASPWVELTDTDIAAGTTSSAYLIATGGETTGVLTAAGTADQVVVHALRITAASWHGTTVPEANATDNGVAADNPDGGASLNPAGWGTEATLWIIFLGLSGAANVTTYPTGFDTNGAHTISSSTGMASSWLTETAASKDPDAYLLDSATNESVSVVVAVRPAAETFSASRKFLLGIG